MVREVVSQALKGYSNCYPKGKSTFCNKSPVLDLSALHVHLRFLEARLTNLSSLQHKGCYCSHSCRVSPCGESSVLAPWLAQHHRLLVGIGSCQRSSEHVVQAYLRLLAYWLDMTLLLRSRLLFKIHYSPYI